MNFNDASNQEKSIYHDTKSKVGIDAADTTTYPVDPDFTRDSNNNVRRIAIWLWLTSDEWMLDDDGHTTLPEATTTLVDGQGDYDLAASVFALDAVYAKNSAGDFQKLTAIKKSDIPGAVDEWLETDGMPRYWFIDGNQLRVKPAPASADVTLASGLKVVVSLRDINEFATTDTDTEPGFHAFYHPLLSILNAIDYARDNQQPERLKNLKELAAEYRFDLNDINNMRNRGIPTRLTPARTTRGAYRNASL